MRIVIIGAGNAATALGKKCVEAGHTVLQVYNREENGGKSLALKLNSDFTTDPLQLNQQADIYLLAVADNAIDEISSWLKLEKKLIVHTAGSVSMHALKNISRNYGVLYPLQSLRKEMNELPAIPFLVDGNTEDNIALIMDFAQTISTQVAIANDEQRLKIHVAAVVVSNFTNHLYALAAEYCSKENVPFNMMLPLIKEVANRLNYFPPQQMQTGPAVRNDVATIEKQIGLLKNYKELKEIYSLFTKSIQQHNLSKPT